MHMLNDYQLVRLNNGICSVRSLVDHETFHPVVGPVAEAEALYVNQLKLRERIQNTPGEFVIWDVGLGAAANVLTALRAMRDIKSKLRILSFDHTPAPLEFALQHAGELGYFGGYEEPLSELLRTQRVTFLNGQQMVDWNFHLGDFPAWLKAESENRKIEIPAPHAILFDAYSPARNPTMWTLPVFTDLFQCLDPQRPCTMPTYSRSTILRVTLLLAGFYVGVGHATGLKEETTIAANRLDLLAEPLGQRWLERAQRSHSAEPMIESVYRTAPLSATSMEKLHAHQQFQSGN
jgi:tRNA U34 5-methylaminomethyl-2-thiouridine-forming methyltransferase MnmC